jgi:cell division protein FtsN
MLARPTNSWSSEESGSDEEEEADEQDEAEGSGSASGSEGESEDEEAARARMLAALEAHQAAFLQDAAPTLVAKARQDKGKAVAAKPIWEMDMDDFEDEEDEDSEEEEDEEGECCFAYSMRAFGSFVAGLGADISILAQTTRRSRRARVATSRPSSPSQSRTLPQPVRLAPIATCETSW